MKKTLLLLFSLKLIASPCAPCTYYHPEEPQLTVVIVIDQCAYRHLEKLKTYLTHGLKFFMNQGICYKEAYVPYAWPETAPGHASLSTGCTPCDHGIITNGWLSATGKEIACDEDEQEKTAVFGANGLQDVGRSASKIMVDGISDQLILQTQQHKNYKVFSVSGKSRAAICTANKLGKAIWLDDTACMFTSSKAYFNELPAWVKRFNERKNIRNMKYTWKLANTCPGAYAFRNTRNLKGSKYKQSLIGRTFSLCDQRKEFMQTPQANQLVFDAALTCIDEHFNKENKDEKLFMWVLPSALDKVGHNFGPESIEAIDTVYHLDRQIQHFMNCVYKKTNKRNVLWVVTADHGMTLLPEQVREQGYTGARRILGPEVIKDLNAHLAQTCNVENLALLFNANSIYVNDPLFKSLERPVRKKVIKETKSFMRNLKGIRNVWTAKELSKLPTHKGTILDSFKHQIFKGRSGRFIVQSYPFVYVSQKKTGLSHQSPYSYDTHIPIMIYQRGKLQHKTIYERVTNTQLAPTLAHLLGVPRPSACTTDILPGIIFKPDPCF